MKKFGRSSEHRAMLMKSLVTNLILAESIKTTLPKAKEARKDADKIVTIAKKGDLAARRLAASRLLQPKAVKKLFDKIAPAMKDRKGGYTRIEGRPEALRQDRPRDEGSQGRLHTHRQARDPQGRRG